MRMTCCASILVLALSGFLPGQAHGQIIIAGDNDNFGDWQDPSNPSDPDYLAIRPSFAAWLARPGGSNHTDHGGVPMPFDMDTNDEAFQAGGSTWRIDWEFGYSFMNLPPLAPGATLRLHLKASGFADSDTIGLQYTGSTPGFSYSVHLVDLPESGGSWDNLSGDEAVFTLALGNLPAIGSGDLNLIDDINAAGYLDVFVQDDTAVDWIELTIPEPGSLALLALCTLSLRSRRRPV